MGPTLMRLTIGGPRLISHTPAVHLRVRVVRWARYAAKFASDRGSHGRSKMRAGVAVISSTRQSTILLPLLCRLHTSVSPQRPLNSPLFKTRDDYKKLRCSYRPVSAMASSYKPEDARVPPAIKLPLPPVPKFKIALCQLLVTADKERNISHARKAIEEAAENGAQLVILPEIWNSPYSNDSFPVYAEDIDAGGDASPSSAMLSEVARCQKITIVGGSIPERSGDRLYNTCCVFGTDGKLKAKHRKIHLFDIDIPGKITFQESKTLTAGETPTIVDTDVGRIGIGICYDIRFQELAMLYGARGAHLICYPGAFNMTTGPLHWELLQRARMVKLPTSSLKLKLESVTVSFNRTLSTILTDLRCNTRRANIGFCGRAADNQLYVATCSPARDVGSGYVAWGHSTLVGPFGELIATTEHDEAIIMAEIDYSLIELRRTNLPLEKQRRGDLYQLIDVKRLHSV